MAAAWAHIVAPPPFDAAVLQGWAARPGRSAFAPAEDELLARAVLRFGCHADAWTLLAVRYLLPARTAGEVKRRFKKATEARAPPNPVRDARDAATGALRADEVDLIRALVDAEQPGGGGRAGAAPRVRAEFWASVAARYLPYRHAKTLPRLWREAVAGGARGAEGGAGGELHWSLRRDDPPLSLAPRAPLSSPPPASPDGTGAGFEVEELPSSPSSGVAPAPARAAKRARAGAPASPTSPAPSVANEWPSSSTDGGGGGGAGDTPASAPPVAAATSPPPPPPPPPPSTTDAALVVDGVITHWSKDDDRALLRACLVAARGAPTAADLDGVAAALPPPPGGRPRRTAGQVKARFAWLKARFDAARRGG
jgi:hypothetical protein